MLVDEGVKPFVRFIVIATKATVFFHHGMA